jgi:hypothetical protein
MIGHAVYLEHLVVILFMRLLLNDAGNVLMQSCFSFFLNEGGMVFNSKYQLNVELSVGVGHD